MSRLRGFNVRRHYSRARTLRTKSSTEDGFIFLFPSFSVVLPFRLDKRASGSAPELCKQQYELFLT